MVKVYAITLSLGILSLLVIILGGSFAENIDRPDRDPGEIIGLRGKMAVGAALGFGMGGMSAEFSPLDFNWGVSLVIALLAGAVSMVWVRYAVARANN